VSDVKFLAGSDLLLGIGHRFINQKASTRCCPYYHPCQQVEVYSTSDDAMKLSDDSTVRERSGLEGERFGTG
jgi:hypothetical protein